MRTTINAPKHYLDPKEPRFLRLLIMISSHESLKKGGRLFGVKVASRLLNMGSKISALGLGLSVISLSEDTTAPSLELSSPCSRSCPLAVR